MVGRVESATITFATSGFRACLRRRTKKARPAEAKVYRNTKRDSLDGSHLQPGCRVYHLLKAFGRNITCRAVDIGN